MKNLYQYERDGQLHIEYSTDDGNDVHVIIEDHRIVIHDAYELQVSRQYINKLEIEVIAPPQCKARNLCYAHHRQEFDKLSNDSRHLASNWRTVLAEECELCQEAEPKPDIVAIESDEDPEEIIGVEARW